MSNKLSSVHNLCTQTPHRLTSARQQKSRHWSAEFFRTSWRNDVHSYHRSMRRSRGGHGKTSVEFVRATWTQSWGRITCSDVHWNYSSQRRLLCDRKKLAQRQGNAITKRYWDVLFVRNIVIVATPILFECLNHRPQNLINICSLVLTDPRM